MTPAYLPRLRDSSLNDWKGFCGFQVASETLPYANGPYVVLHASQDGPVQVDTGRRSQIVDLMSGEQLGQGPKITFPMELGETRVLVASDVR